ncbi:hypothetical protein [Enterobacter ludwigii]|uniref:hypothetical protein n=1 Tax=Enterobacter ludwigii TaxID=299767 RepID=UPI003975E3DE
MSAKQKSGLLVIASIFLPLMLSACNTRISSTGSDSACGRIPPTINKTRLTEQRIPLPYKVNLTGTSDEHMRCENCGNNGEIVLIKGGEKLSQYHFMVDSPYYIFLWPRNSDGRPSKSWVAINKNNSQPHAEKICLGNSSEISKIIPANDQHNTWLQVTYQDGTQKVFVFDNDK